MRRVLNFFLCFRSELATDEVVLHGTIRLDSKIRSQNVHFHDSFWREQTLAATKLFLSLTRIDFAVLVSSRAVRVFPALSLRRVRPSYGTFSLMVFQGNCARGSYGSYDKHLLLTEFEGRTVSCGPSFFLLYLWPKRERAILLFFVRSDGNVTRPPMELQDRILTCLEWETAN